MWTNKKRRMCNKPKIRFKKTNNKVIQFSSTNIKNIKIYILQITNSKNNEFNKKNIE